MPPSFCTARSSRAIHASSAPLSYLHADGHNERCKSRKDGASKEGGRRSESIPQPTSQDARDEQRGAGQQIEQTKGRASQAFRRGIGDEGREQALRKAHIEAPKGRRRRIRN